MSRFHLGYRQTGQIRKASVKKRFGTLPPIQRMAVQQTHSTFIGNPLLNLAPMGPLCALLGRHNIILRCVVNLSSPQCLLRVFLKISFRNGQQAVSYNVTHTGDLFDATSSGASGLPGEEYAYLLQLSSVSVATRSLLLGSVSVLHGASGDIPRLRSSVLSAAFFDSSLNSGSELTWGDVPRGIEQLSHNVSAAILTMDLGFQDSRCAISKVSIVYEYNRLNLLLPYGVSTFPLYCRFSYLTLH